MRKQRKGRILLAASASLTVLAMSAGPGQAQGIEEAPNPVGGIDEIIVTAQKRSTNLQDTPVAISAFSGDALEERGIDDMTNLQSYVPNLNVGSEQDGVKISLRGIGLQGTTSISDSGVAFYVDNFYVGRPAGGSAVFFDVDRIEVLRGPQGTLYGRNATGGVVNVITKAPSQKFEGQIGASYGSRDMFEVRGLVNVPLTDIAAFRMSAVYTKEDGYVKNLSTNAGTKNGFGTDGDLSVRGQLLVGDKDEVEVLLSGNYSKQNGTGATMRFLERNIGGPPPVQALLRTINPPIDADPLVTNNNAPAYLDIETTTAFGRVTKDFGGVEAVVQLGKMWQTSDLLQDFDGSSVDVGRFVKYQDSEATSLEARLASTGSGPFSWILGGYYFKESAYILRVVELRGLTPGGPIRLPDFILDEEGSSKTLAAFGSATYAISPAFRATVGLRYTDDKKAGSKVTRGNFGQPFPPDIPNAQFSGITSFDKLTWKAGVEFDAAQDILVYASASTGYKAGGFNISSDASPYRPEKITAYELGLKSDFWDRRARVNIDAFYYDYTDMQLTTLGTFGPSNAPGQFTVNAGQSRIYGIEIDTQLKPADGFLLSASYAYTDAKFTELSNRDPRDNILRNLKGNIVPYVSKHVINAGAQYELELGATGSLTLGANYNWHSRKFLREFNDPIIDLVPSNGRTDITITYRMADNGLRLTGFVTNLENDIEKNNIYVSPGFIGSSAVASYTKPRTFGIRADWSF